LSWDIKDKKDNDRETGRKIDELFVSKVITLNAHGKRIIVTMKVILEYVAQLHMQNK